MTREAIPLVVPDAGTFARALGRALVERHADKPTPPGHVELLNLLARAAGHRSYQGLRSAARMPGAAAALELRPQHPQREPLDRELVRPAHQPAEGVELGQGLACGRCQRRGRRRGIGKRVYTEREVNEVIKRWHTWGDHVTLRRELINHQLLTRKSDGSEYRKLPARPDDEVRWLLRAWRERVRLGA
jgi:hypothetical protein